VLGALFVDARTRDEQNRKVPGMMRALTAEWASRTDPEDLARVLPSYEFVEAAASLSADNEFRPIRRDPRLSQARVTALADRARETGAPAGEGDEVAIPVFREGKFVRAVYIRFVPPPPSAFEPLKAVYLILLLGAAAGVAATTWVLRRRVLAPLAEVEEAARRVARGDYATPVRVPEGEDEIATVASSFNAMMREVSAYRQDLEARVGQATKKMRQAERNLVTAQRLVAMGTLAAGIAHEINNPLGGMVNAARSLRRADLPPEKREEYLALVEDGLERVGQTVQKVLQFSPHRVSPQACDLARVAERALALASHRVEEAKARVTVQFPDGGLPVFGDPYELQQVVLNLLVNAADAVAEAGRPERRIALRGSLEEAEVRLAVEDDGVGMTEEQVAKAFDLFFSTKEVGRGSGLGLSIAHSVVESHGGKVVIRSKRGVGTTVEIVLPLSR